MPALQSTLAPVIHTEKRLSNPKYSKVVLHNAIINFNENDLKLSLNALKKLKLNLNDKISDKSPPPLFTAIINNNVSAVRELIKSDLVDVRVEWEGVNAINWVALTGNPTILNLVYTRDKNVNDICYDTPLIKGLVQFPSFSIVHNSNWGSAELKEILISWFNNGTSFNGEINYGDQYQNEPTLEATWDGSVEMIRSLLDYGANPKVRGENGLSAEYFVNNVDKAECRKIISDADSLDSLKFITKSADNNVLTFHTTIANRNKTKKIRIKLNYDTRQVKKLINDAAQKVVGAPTSPNFKEWDERLNTVKSAAESASALAASAHAKADQHAANTHFHVQTLHSKVDAVNLLAQTTAAVTQNNAVVLAHTISRVDKTEADIKTIIEDYSPLKEAANRARELAIIKASKTQNSFYEAVHKKISVFINSCKQLNGGMIQNQDYSIAHKVGSAVELVGGKIPIIGIDAGLLAKV